MQEQLFRRHQSHKSSVLLSACFSGDESREARAARIADLLRKLKYAACALAAVWAFTSFKSVYVISFSCMLGCSDFKAT